MKKNIKDEMKKKAESVKQVSKEKAIEKMEEVVEKAKIEKEAKEAETIREDYAFEKETTPNVEEETAIISNRRLDEEDMLTPPKGMSKKKKIAGIMAAVLVAGLIGGGTVYALDELDDRHDKDNHRVEHDVYSYEGEGSHQGENDHLSKEEQQGEGNSYYSEEVISEEGLIGKEKATTIALEKVGLTEEKVTNLQVELDIDDRGNKEYEVEFDNGGYEYSYDITGVDGEITHEEIEKSDVL